MIPIYTKEHHEEFQKMEGRLGTFVREHIDGMGREINRLSELIDRHIADTERHNVPLCDIPEATGTEADEVTTNSTEELDDAGESTKADSQDSGLPRNQLGERST